MAEMKMCQKCGRMKNADTQFYQYKNKEKTELCKDCLTMHIDNYDPSTFLWLLEKMDVPYVPEEWNVLRDRAAAKNPLLNGMSVFGKYLSKMKLKQWKDYGWADTEKIQARNAEQKKLQAEQQKQFDEELKQQLDSGEITDAQFKTMTSATAQHEDFLMNPERYIPGAENSYSNPDTYIDESLIDLGGDLTQEDKIYLAMKWGRTFRPNEWVALERNYNEMMKSFDIQDADTINTLILICKTYLKMNDAVDCGDMDGYQKLSRVYDSLRKSAKFTAAQKKEQSEDYIDSIGMLAFFCERDGGFIPRYATDIPQDKVDITLKDFENYAYKLITNDLGFGQQIENYMKKIELEKEAEKLHEDDTLSDDDIKDFYENIEKQKEEDAPIFEEEEEG